jgi:hypothetical protein
MNSAFMKFGSADKKEWDTGSHSNPQRTRRARYF